MKYTPEGPERIWKSYRLPLLIISVMLLAGCDSNRVYEKNIDFRNKQWVVNDTVKFQFEIKAPQKAYNVYWNVRNSISYPYRNLYLTYYLEDTLGHRIAKDLHNVLLFEPKTGKPYGDGLGDIFTHQFLALPGYKFDTAGIYQIRLEQYMRTDTLQDILSVGVRVEEAETQD